MCERESGGMDVVEVGESSGMEDWSGGGEWVGG